MGMHNVEKLYDKYGIQWATVDDAPTLPHYQPYLHDGSPFTTRLFMGDRSAAFSFFTPFYSNSVIPASHGLPVLLRLLENDHILHIHYHQWCRKQLRDVSAIETEWVYQEKCQQAFVFKWFLGDHYEEFLQAFRSPDEGAIKIEGNTWSLLKDVVVDDEIAYDEEEHPF